MEGECENKNIKMKGWEERHLRLMNLIQENTKNFNYLLSILAEVCVSMLFTYFTLLEWRNSKNAGRQKPIYKKRTKKWLINSINIIFFVA